MRVQVPISNSRTPGIGQICLTPLDKVGASISILERALESKDPKTALNAIGAAVNVLREAWSYLELRGEITGELNKSASASPSFGINQVEKLLVIRMPKTPAAEAEERRILARMGDKFSFIPPYHSQIASPAETDEDDDQEGH